MSSGMGSNYVGRNHFGESNSGKVVGNLLAGVFSAYLVLSFVGGKAYNDCQRAIEKNNRIVAAFPTQERSDNSKLERVVSFVKDSPLYWPFGYMYDKCEGRR